MACSKPLKEPEPKWQFWDSSWQNYSPAASAELEAAFRRGDASLSLNIGNDTYIVFIPEFLQMNTTTSFRRAVRRFVEEDQCEAPDYKWQFDNNGQWVDYPHYVNALLCAASVHCKYKQICIHCVQPFVVDLAQGKHITQGGNVSSVKAEPNKPGLPALQLGQQAATASATSTPTAASARSETDDRLTALGISYTSCSDELLENQCAICFDNLSDTTRPTVQLPQCEKHGFHHECILHCIVNESLKCPVCSTIYGRPMMGNQPDGTMTVENFDYRLPGHPEVSTIVITYYFPPSRQRADHPTPGRPLPGDTRRAFLPNNTQGQEILRLLRIAWERKLIFTVGISLTFGAAAGERIVWNGIHHKTALSGEHGFPDDTYYARVKDELAQLGVV